MITLTPMTETDLQKYLAKAIPSYAEDKVQAGNWTREEAEERSRQEFEGYLPQGVQTPGNYLFNLMNDQNECVGFLWYAVSPKQPRVAFIYDFEIFEQFRRRGYAREALAALDDEAKQRGLNRIELHVFAHNTAARALYQKAGYFETNVLMARNL